MNRKFILIAIICAIILGISIAVISNKDKIKNAKSTESLAQINTIESNTNNLNNKFEETENNVTENSNNTIIADNSETEVDTNSTQKEVTNKDSNSPKIKDNSTASTSNSKKEDPNLSNQTSVVPYAISTDEIKKIDNGNSHTFIGTVTDINDMAVIIKPDDGYNGISGNQITLKKSKYGSGLELNDKVEITFIG
ncbi:MAG: hypothetical protein HUJ68_05395, partial [Clostridia bacterium]|nr:hypothetical protein [Clostridia bacterium]